MKRIALLLLMVCLLWTVPVLAVETVVLDTNYGTITLKLDEEKAPVTVANFLEYVNAGHYDGTVFHRVIKDFMIQGGNLTPEMTPKKTRPPIKNEANNGLRNLRGTIAMARTAAVNSATSQFFINLSDNRFLDHMVRDYGYAVFGRVASGMDVVDKIGNGPTHTYKRFPNVPVDMVIIEKAYQLKSE